MNKITDKIRHGTFDLKNSIPIHCTNVVAMFKADYGLKEFNLKNVGKYKKIKRDKLKVEKVCEATFDEFLGEEIQYTTGKTIIGKSYLDHAIKILTLMDSNWDWDVYEYTGKKPSPLILINDDNIAIAIAPRLKETKGVRKR